MYKPTTVAGIAPEYELVQDSCTINDILMDELEMDLSYFDYGCLFVLRDDDDNLVRVYGTEQIIPRLHHAVDLIFDREEIANGSEDNNQPGQCSLW